MAQDNAPSPLDTLLGGGASKIVVKHNGDIVSAIVHIINIIGGNVTWTPPGEDEDFGTLNITVAAASGIPWSLHGNVGSDELQPSEVVPGVGIGFECAGNGQPLTIVAKLTTAENSGVRLSTVGAGSLEIDAPWGNDEQSYCRGDQLRGATAPPKPSADDINHVIYWDGTKWEHDSPDAIDILTRENANTVCRDTLQEYTDTVGGHKTFGYRTQRSIPIAHGVATTWTVNETEFRGAFPIGAGASKHSAVIELELSGYNSTGQWFTKVYKGAIVKTVSGGTSWAWAVGYALTEKPEMGLGTITDPLTVAFALSGTRNGVVTFSVTYSDASDPAGDFLVDLRIFGGGKI